MYYAHVLLLMSLDFSYTVQLEMHVQRKTWARAELLSERGRQCKANEVAKKKELYMAKEADKPLEVTNRLSVFFECHASTTISRGSMASVALCWLGLFVSVHLLASDPPSIHDRPSNNGNQLLNGPHQPRKVCTLFLIVPISASEHIFDMKLR